MIITNNEEALRVKCYNASQDEVGHIISLLEQELRESNRLGKFGIGLAAPQIGINKNVAIVRIDNNYHVNLVNCKIQKSFDPTIFRNEGCLSFPGRVEDTMRYQEIYVTDNLVYPHSFIVTGLMAVVCQHEIGHWNQDLFFDHMIEKPNNKKVKPNDPCICGKPKKYKKCCGK
jgi:peptide deformylase